VRGGARKLAELVPDLRDEPCIYVLFHDNEPLYVGQTKRPKTRIGNHLSEPMTQRLTTSIDIFYCDESELDSHELEMMAALKPRWGYSHPNTTQVSRN